MTNYAAIAQEYEGGTDGGPRGGGRQRRTQADILIGLAEAGELCHNSNAEVFARFGVEDHIETWPVRSKAFRWWLTKRFLENQGKAPNSQALETAVRTLEAIGFYHGPEEQVFLRVGRAGDRLYLDLGDRTWRVIEITSSGWGILGESPIWFRRAPGMEPLPEPVVDGSLTKLDEFLNVEHKDDLVLLIGWLINTLFSTGPYPVLVLIGEQGSAKSTTATVLRRLIDPSSTALRSPPRDGRDLMISALNSWMIVIDNVSDLPGWLSDALCRIATGGGFATRQLYTDTDEVLFSAQRPIIVNGIEDPLERDDLRDRAVFLTLPPIADSSRRSEREFWAAFDEAAPTLLGGLLDALVGALRNYPTIVTTELPRMADFARRIAAAEPALGWKSGTFLTAYSENRQAASEFAVEDNRIATELVAVANQGDWSGTATELLRLLEGRVSDDTKRRKWWPKGPRALSGAVRRAAPGLRRIGVSVEFSREAGGHRRRIISVNLRVHDRPHRPDGAGDHGADDREPDHPAYRDRPGERAQGGRWDGRDANSPSHNVGAGPGLESNIFLPPGLAGEDISGDDPEEDMRAALREGA